MLYKIRKMTKTFKNRTILNLEQLDIEKGEIYALVGANGAGKTTLLNILSFLDKPHTGQLDFCGEPVLYGNQQLLKLRRKVVLLDQYPILFTGPVWKNIEFGLKVRSIPRAQRKKRVEEVLNLVGMGDFFHAEGHKLSGGETKRVALARALAIEPEVLLCDEPTANVDAENQAIILNILQQINSEQKTSIIFATHYLSQMRKLASHTLTLEHGHLSQQKKENSYICTVITRKENGLLCYLNNAVSLFLAGNNHPEVEKGTKIHIDPRRISIGKSKNSLAENTLRGVVVKIEQNNTLIGIDMDCGLRIRVILTKDEYHDLQPQVGEKLQIGIPDEAIEFSP